MPNNFHKSLCSFKVNRSKLRLIFFVILFLGWFSGGNVKASSVANVFYSVGQNTANHSSGGNVSISGGVAVFSVAQNSANLGIGDRLTAGGNAYYLASKISTTQWNVVTKIGAVPANLASTAVSSISH
jgi:hypothetical protein